MKLKKGTRWIYMNCGLNYNLNVNNNYPALNATKNSTTPQSASSATTTKPYDDLLESKYLKFSINYQNHINLNSS